jgi:hypothetical protein
MLLRFELAFMAVWLVGVVGLYDIGKAVHVLFLLGGMLLLLGSARARDAVMVESRRAKEPGDDGPRPGRR